MRWEELREEEFEDAIKKSKGLCIVPMGCLEKHGQHLPVGTDYYIAEHMAYEIAKVEDVVVFPTGFWLGNVMSIHSGKYSKVKGGFALSPITFQRILEELCDEIARNGFDKILLFNIHGGSLFDISEFIRNQERKEKPYTTLTSPAILGPTVQPTPFLETVLSRRDEFPMMTDEDIEVMRKWEICGYQGGHANLLETVLLMAAQPGLTDPDKYDAECGINNHRTDYMLNLGVVISNDWCARYPNMYSGAAPHGASENIGNAMVKIHVETFVKGIRLIKNTEFPKKSR